MRTSIEIPDALLARARRVARRRKLTLRALVEEGLRHVVSQEGTPAYRLEDRSFAGDGYAAGVAADDWEKIRELIYEGRGS
jgi:Arc/MetJ family transcription regulator